MSNAYILITPCKNEEQSLPEFMQSVINQTIQPKLWVIVNDGSTDKSKSIILSYCNDYPWIQIVDLPEMPRDSFLRYAYVCRVGFDHAIKVASRNDIDYNF